MYMNFIVFVCIPFFICCITMLGYLRQPNKLDLSADEADVVLRKKVAFGLLAFLFFLGGVFGSYHFYELIA